MPKTINIKIPDTIIENYRTIDELERSIYEDIIVSEYLKGNLSIRDSAELLGLTYEGFIEFLGERKHSFISATKNELEESYHNFEAFMRTYDKP
jgi:predicted HTH domain antitoxin